MAIPTLLELADVGAHFGHNRSLTYPKAKEFVFTTRNGISLINLELTQAAITTAQKMFQQALANKQTILFVGTKSSIRPIIQEIAEGQNLPYITERWFGGTLTNFETIIGNIKKMNELDAYLQDEKSKTLSKKERLTQNNKLAHYQRFLGGMAQLTKLPDLLIVASASADKVAITEARQMNIPVIAICDTDVNPFTLTVAVPANDDAPKAVRMVLEAIVSTDPIKVVTKKEKAEVAVSEEEPVKTVKKTVKKVAPKKAETTEKKAAKVAKKETKPKAETKTKASPKTTKVKKEKK